MYEMWLRLLTGWAVCLPCQLAKTPWEEFANGVVYAPPLGLLIHEQLQTWAHPFLERSILGGSSQGPQVSRSCVSPTFPLLYGSLRQWMLPWPELVSQMSFRKGIESRPSG